MARLDTGWHTNPKILRLSAVGMALHAWSISYCDDVRSDGFIPNGAWPGKLGRGVKELRIGKLWEPVEGGYRLHDYLDYNRSRAQIDAEQSEARERMRLVRANKTRTNGARSPGVHPNVQATFGRSSRAFPVPGVRSTSSSSSSVTPGQLRAREAPTTTTTDLNLDGLPDEMRDAVIARLSQPALHPAHG